MQLSLCGPLGGLFCSRAQVSFICKMLRWAGSLYNGYVLPFLCEADGLPVAFSFSSLALVVASRHKWFDNFIVKLLDDI